MSGDHHSDCQELDSFSSENVAPSSSRLSLIADLQRDCEDICARVCHLQLHLDNKEQMETAALLSLNKLETQYTALDNTVKSAVYERSQNEALREQIRGLENSIDERDKTIAYLESLVKSQITQRNEVLNECTIGANMLPSNNLVGNPLEHNHSIASVMDQNAQLQHALASKDKYCLNLEDRYRNEKHSKQEQGREIKSLRKELCDHQKTVAKLESINIDLQVERNFLKTEMCTLKEREAILVGAQSALKDQLACMEKELFAAHKVIKDQQGKIEMLGIKHEQAYTRLQNSAEKTELHHKQLEEKYEILQKNYLKEVSMRKQCERALDTYRQFKEAQMIADKDIRAYMDKKDETIRKLQQENSNFMVHFSALQSDCLTLQNELDRIRTSYFSRHSSAQNSEHPLPEELQKRLDLLRQLSIRLASHASTLPSAAANQCGHRSNASFLNTNPFK